MSDNDDKIIEIDFSDEEADLPLPSLIPKEVTLHKDSLVLETGDFKHGLPYCTIPFDSFNSFEDAVVFLCAANITVKAHSNRKAVQAPFRTVAPVPAPAIVQPIVDRPTSHALGMTPLPTTKTITTSFSDPLDISDGNQRNGKRAFLDSLTTPKYKNSGLSHPKLPAPPEGKRQQKPLLNLVPQSSATSILKSYEIPGDPAPRVTHHEIAAPFRPVISPTVPPIVPPPPKITPPKIKFPQPPSQKVPILKKLPIHLLKHNSIRHYFGIDWSENAKKQSIYIAIKDWESTTEGNLPLKVNDLIWVCEHPKIFNTLTMVGGYKIEKLNDHGKRGVPDLNGVGWFPRACIRMFEFEQIRMLEFEQNIPVPLDDPCLQPRAWTSTDISKPSRLSVVNSFDATSVFSIIPEHQSYYPSDPSMRASSPVVDPRCSKRRRPAEPVNMQITAMPYNLGMPAVLLPNSFVPPLPPPLPSSAVSVSALVDSEHHPSVNQSTASPLSYPIEELKTSSELVEYWELKTSSELGEHWVQYHTQCIFIIIFYILL